MVRTRLTFAGILLLAFAATGAWLAQLLWGVGWDGLAWVSLIEGPETLPSCFFVALAMAVPWAPRSKTKPLYALALVVLLSLAGFGVYQAAAPLIAAFFHPRALMFMAPEQVAQALLIGLAAVAALGAGFSAIAWSLLRWLAGPVRWWGLLLFPLALVLVVPLAWAVVQALPAVNGSQDFVHAVKMGYPPGCTALLLGLASWLARPPGEPASLCAEE